MPSQDPSHLQLRTTSHKVQEELEYWERLVFSFEMNKDNEPSRTIRGKNQGQQQGSRSASSPNQSPDASGSGLYDATLLAQIAAASGSGTDFDHSSLLLNSNPYSQPPPVAPGLYNNFFPSIPMGHTQLPPISSLDFAWNQLAHQQGLHPMYNLPMPGQLVPPIPFPNTLHSVQVPPIIPPPQPNNTGRRDRRASLASSSQPSRQRAVSVSATSPTTSVAGNSSVEGDDPTEAERTVITEEKRRRNTAASARFRIKKKQRTINLERTVSDLSGRAEELEKEVTDLRRENGWLKEIVVLKGTRYAAAASTQQRMALSQAVKDAGIDLTVEGTGQASTSGASGSASGSTKEPQEISSDDDSDGDYAEVDKKGKGKKPVHKGKSRK